MKNLKIKEMREVLFRGKRIDNGEWIEGGYWRPKDPLCEEPNEECYVIITEDLGDVIGSQEVQVIPETVGQFTGFEFGCNKSFEGDLIQTVNMRTGDKYLWLITFKYGSWHANDFKGTEMLLQDFFEECDYPEIIGNIHDNPELIK